MKRLPFTPKRLRCVDSCGREWAGWQIGHYVSYVRHWFSGKGEWVRWYRVRVLSVPQGDPYAVRDFAAERCSEWCALSDSPGEYDTSVS